MQLQIGLDRTLVISRDVKFESASGPEIIPLAISTTDHQRRE